MDEHYEQFLMNRLEMNQLRKDMKGREYFEEAFKYYFHSHIDWFEKSIGSMYGEKALDVLITGVDFKGEMGEKVYVKYQALLKFPWGIKFSGEVPIDELRPKDHDPKLMKEKKENKNPSRKIWP